MNLKMIAKTAGTFLKAHSDTITKVGGVVCFVGFTYTLISETLEADKELHKVRCEKARELYEETGNLEDADPKNVELDIKEYVKITAPIVWPSVALGMGTLGFFFASNKIVSDRALKLASENLELTSGIKMSQEAFKKYRQKQIEKHGEEDDQETMNDIATDKLEELGKKLDVHSGPDMSLIEGRGSELCVDLWTGKIFKADKYIIESAVNDMNEKLDCDGSASLNDFYDLLDIGHIDGGDFQGFYKFEPKERFRVHMSPVWVNGVKVGIGLSYETNPMFDFRDY